MNSLGIAMPTTKQKIFISINSFPYTGTSSCFSLPIFFHLLSFFPSFYSLFNLFLQLGYSLYNFLCQHVPKACKRLALAFEILILPLREFDKFSSIDVGVSTTFDVIDDLGRNLSGQVGRRGRQR